MEVALPLLAILGMGLACVLILFGLIGLARKRLSLTPGKVLQGLIAEIVGALCVLMGAAFIAYIVFMVRSFPDGLGH